jgi:hypothetical protein
MVCVGMFRSGGAAMKKISYLVLSSLLTSGCGTDLSKFSLVSAPQLSGLLGQTNTLEQQLIVALQAEDDYLNFVSLGNYSCGDPNDKQQKVFIRTKDPAQLVKQQKVNKVWQTSVDFIAAYVKALNKIVSDNTTELNDVASLTTAANLVVQNVPGFPPGTAAAASAFQKATDDVITAVNNGRMTQAAQLMEPQLEGAVKYIKKYYPVFTGPEQLAFQKWDSCALETLAFLRDDPMGRLPKNFPPYFVVSSGTELQTAYAAYLAQRQQFRNVPPIADLLKKIVDENKKIAQPDLTLASVQASAQNAVAIYKDGMAAIAAAKNVNKTPSKTGG